MNEEPNDHYNQYGDSPLPADDSTASKRGFNLTGLGARLGATALAIGLGVLILSYAMRSSGNEPATEIAQEPTATINAAPLATWTPGPTSTPPPPANPTPEPAAEEAAPAASDPNANPDPNTPAGFANGAKVQVTGTDGLGVNMRQNSGVNSDLVDTLPDGTVLEIINGPIEADGYTWWQVRLEDGREGWVVQLYMTQGN